MRHLFEIEKTLKEQSQKYYSDGSNTMSDAEFDKLLSQVKKEDPNSDLFKVGHGYDVNLDPSNSLRVPHKYGVVKSLDKCHNWDELSTDFKKDSTQNKIILSLKLDGISSISYFVKGKLVQSLTRGDGNTGIDITDRVKTILSNQKNSFEVDEWFTGAIRGEILMTYDNFDKYCILHSDDKEKPKNPRNLTAGLVKSGEDLQFLNLIVYTVTAEENDMLFGNYEGMLDWLKKDFNYVVPYEITDNKEINPQNLINKMNQCHDKWYGKIPADGIVLAMNDLEYNNNQILYNSLAFKFPTESKETTVKDIAWVLSKTGYFIPRINFEPVELDGTTVQFCTGNNAQSIKDWHIGIGSKIKVTKANMIIPYLEEVITKKDYKLPEICPACGQPLAWAGVHLQCQNKECKNSDIQDALIWFENLVPTNGLGEILILRFLAVYLGEENISVENIHKHGSITLPYNDLKQEALFVNTFNRLFTDKFKLDTCIKALNILRFGDVNSVKLAKYPEIVQNLMNKDFIVDSNYDSYLRSTIGDANTSSLLKNRNKIYRLNLIKDQILFNSEDISKLKGKIVVTGALETCSRKEFKELVKKFGYELSEALNKDTLFLVTNTPESSSAKNQKADKLGIKKITEKEFISNYCF